MSIKEMPPATRPREKLLAHGAQALADVELLALLLRTGSGSLGVLQLAERLLAEFDGLAGLMHAQPSELARSPGVGPAKQAEIAAVREISRRALGQRLKAAPVLGSSQAVKDFVALGMARLDYEAFAVMFLDSQFRLLEMKELFRGSLAQTSVYPREVLRQALQLNAAAVVLVHNHPSGVAEPSKSDEALTRALATALRAIEVRVMDQLVVGAGYVVSFAERGLMP